MIERLLVWGVRRYVDGPARSWIYTSAALLGLRAVRSAVGRREVVDVGDIKPGQRVVIEHLPISHGKQMKAMKAEAATVKKAERSARKASRREARSTRREARDVKRTAREAKRTARRERRAAGRAERSATTGRRPTTWLARRTASAGDAD